MGTNPDGKKLGILGMGGIGKAIAKRARAFDMEIQYHNRSRLPTEGMFQQYSRSYEGKDTYMM